MSEKDRQESYLYTICQSFITKVYEYHDTFDKLCCFNEGEPENALLKTFFDTSRILNEEFTVLKDEYIYKCVVYPAIYIVSATFLFKIGFKRPFERLIDREIQGFFKAKKIYESQSDPLILKKLNKKYKGFFEHHNDMEKLKLAAREKIGWNITVNLFGLMLVPSATLHFYGNYVMKNKFREALKHNWIPVGSYQYIHTGPYDDGFLRKAKNLE